jgi:hypothetical protein
MRRHARRAAIPRLNQTAVHTESTSPVGRAVLVKSGRQSGRDFCHERMRFLFFSVICNSEILPNIMSRCFCGFANLWICMSVDSIFHSLVKKKNPKTGPFWIPEPTFVAK